MNGRHSVFAVVGCVLATAFAAAPARAVNLSCVNTPLQLALALYAAQNNGQDDYIQIEVGTYLLGGELDYIAAAAETNYLIVSGGWAPGCFVRASSGSTVLDGQGAVRQLYIHANGNVTINFVTFQNGNATTSAGGALQLTGTANSVLAVNYNVFLDNKDANSAGGAIYVGSLGTLVLNNNLLLANTGTSTIYLVNEGIADVNNNTVVGNSLVNHVGVGALELAGAGNFYLSNNILWSNEGSDLYDASGMAYLYNNDIGVHGGFSAAGESNGLSVDPQFNGFLSVMPAPGSPLVNAGLDNPYGGIGDVDLAGKARLVGQHVDIGAYETDVLLRCRFE